MVNFTFINECRSKKRYFLKKLFLFIFIPLYFQRNWKNVLKKTKNSVCRRTYGAQWTAATDSISSSSNTSFKRRGERESLVETCLWSTTLLFRRRSDCLWLKIVFFVVWLIKSLFFSNVKRLTNVSKIEIVYLKTLLIVFNAV